MRLLFDEQLSEALCLLLRDVFPDSLHTRQIGAGGAPRLLREHVADLQAFAEQAEATFLELG